jgi:hypothetical protein
MKRLLILEDNLKDLGIATVIALKAGFTVVLAESSQHGSVTLSNGIEDGDPLPNAMIL